MKRVLLLAILVVSPLTASAQKRGITEKDLFNFVWVADPQIAPDGSQVAFVRVTVDDKKEGYASAIWIAKYDGGEPPRALTNGPRDTAPRWSPDGRQIAFVRSAEKDGKAEPPQIYLMPVGPGEPKAITDLPKGAGIPEWSPDGRTIAFSSGTKPSEIGAKKDPNVRESDVRIVTEAVYRANGIGGSGFVDRDHPSHIWTVAVPAGAAASAKAKQITAGDFSEGNYRWSKDGSQIYFVSTRRKEAYYYPQGSDLYSVGKDGGEPSRVASIEGSIGNYALSPDGRRVAFVGTLHGDPVRSYSQSDLWVVDLPAGAPRNLTARFDFDVDGSVGGDQRAPRGQEPAGPIWADSRSIMIKVGMRGNADLMAFDTQTGEQKYIGHGTPESHEVISYTADRSARRFAMVISSPTDIGDLYVADANRAARPERLTTFNDALFSQLSLTAPEEFWYTSFDGRKIQGWIQKPPSFDPAVKYPLILEIHGGPHSAYGNTFTHEFQWMAAKGYIVLYVNPRGSSNYGQDFGNSIQYAYPGDDYKDLMAGVDEVLKKGYVDAARLGVTGGSGGGLLTDWVVTQTTRFKAAVSQRDISDWANFWYTADFTLFTPTWFHKAPFEDPAEFAKRSPITYAANIQTPMLFILGDEDYRTPPGAGGEDLFRALKYLRRTAAMARFPGENHELSRSGRPWHRVERLEQIVGWFDKYLSQEIKSSGEPRGVRLAIDLHTQRRSAVANELRNKRVAALVDNGFEQSELVEPKKALEAAGATVDVVSPQDGKVKGWQHTQWADEVAVDRRLAEASANDYDALLLPGGVMNPDKLRANEKAVQFVRAFVDVGKPIAAICHGPWTLIEAGGVKGRKVTSWPSLKTDLRNAGANWVDQEVVVDNGLVTSRKPDDIPAFNRKMIEEFAEGRHDQTRAREMAGTNR